VQSPIGQNGDLESNPFGHSQPVETDERIRDVVRSAEMEYQSRCSVLDRLESADKVDREADQCAITIAR